jgi:hypothetical protein
VLERLSGRSVYNMGLGGYGPNQYFHLLQTKAIKLKPQTIVVGLYMGDDFENAFLITYGLDHWAYLRTLPKEKVSFDIWEAPTAPTWQKKNPNLAVSALCHISARLSWPASRALPRRNPDQVCSPIL